MKTFLFLGCLALLPLNARAATKTGAAAVVEANKMQKSVAKLFEAAHLWEYSSKLLDGWKEGAFDNYYPSADPNRRESFRHEANASRSRARLLVGSGTRPWASTRMASTWINKAGQRMGHAFIAMKHGRKISALVNFDTSELHFKMKNPGRVANPAFVHTLSVKKDGAGWRATEVTNYKRGRRIKNHFQLNARKGIVGQANLR